ncbi:ADP-ribose pyrophosphatase [Bombiscardovia apis]|uniref:ADP-ribose pyrophosphatase n=1 Tax=Bombiscardovia apis TaxID=2932182 RepID=A0ABN6SFS2_9BIFI|nr:NUDIX domain-containing protein [Bombiscardovia apis]BDR54854.1 ADP-ribose pyrophosphatase [Bombiscardovia apis]
MSTPQFVLDLRKSIGHDLLWLNGITAYVQREDGRLLLGKRADSGKWAIVYGINEPGEEPADTVVREVKEETGVDVIVTDFVAVKSQHKATTYTNGDITMYMDHLYLCKPDPKGNIEPFVGDDESLEVGWFEPDQLPQPLDKATIERMKLVHQYLANAARGDRHALFFGGNSQPEIDGDVSNYE